MPAHIRLDQLLALALVSLLLLIQGSVPVESLTHAMGIAQPVKVVIQPVSPVPLTKSAWNDLGAGDFPEPMQPLQLADLSASISAQSALVVDVTSQTLLLDHNSQTLGFPASTVKLMTALVALDKFSPETLLTVTAADVTSNSLPVFRIGEQVAVGDLLKALLITSSNTAAQVLAREYPNGYAGFIEQMNAKAFSLGMTQTTFIDPVGFDWVNQVSSAHDLNLLAQAVMQEPRLRDIVNQPLSVIEDFSRTQQHTLLNTNRLLLANPGQVVGIKTGTTPQAGEVLIAQFELGGRTLRSVVLGSQDRYADTTTLIEAVQQRYVWVEPAELVAQLEDVSVQ